MFKILRIHQLLIQQYHMKNPICNINTRTIFLYFYLYPLGCWIVVPHRHHASCLTSEHWYLSVLLRCKDARSQSFKAIDFRHVWRLRLRTNSAANSRHNTSLHVSTSFIDTAPYPQNTASYPECSWAHFTIYVMESHVGFGSRRWKCRGFDSILQCPWDTRHLIGGSR